MARYMNLSENDRDQFFQEIYDLASNTKRSGLAYAEGIEEYGIIPIYEEV